MHAASSARAATRPWPQRPLGCVSAGAWRFGKRGCASRLASFQPPLATSQRPTPSRPIQESGGGGRRAAPLQTSTQRRRPTGRCQSPPAGSHAFKRQRGRCTTKEMGTSGTGVTRNGGWRWHARPAKEGGAEAGGQGGGEQSAKFKSDTSANAVRQGACVGRGTHRRRHGGRGTRRLS